MLVGVFGYRPIYVTNVSPKFLVWWDCFTCCDMQIWRLYKYSPTQPETLHKSESMSVSCFIGRGLERRVIWMQKGRDLVFCRSLILICECCWQAAPVQIWPGSAPTDWSAASLLFLWSLLCFYWNHYKETCPSVPQCLGLRCCLHAEVFWFLSFDLIFYGRLLLALNIFLIWRQNLHRCKLHPVHGQGETNIELCWR